MSCFLKVTTPKLIMYVTGFVKIVLHGQTLFHAGHYQLEIISTRLSSLINTALQEKGMATRDYCEKGSSMHNYKYLEIRF